MENNGTIPSGINGLISIWLYHEETIGIIPLVLELDYIFLIFLLNIITLWL